MSVTVRHLNADSTFLLIFSPKAQPAPSDLYSANGAFSVLIDPWLVGSSIVNAKWFAVTHRIAPSAISHLSEIEEPDVVLVSQNKPDHCHKQTLLQLKPEGKTLIAAEPGAAKAIKSWNHFDPERVRAMSKYDARAKFGNTLRLRIPPLGPEGEPGELNIAFIPARNYVTGLHNGFGITYQAPTKTRALAHVSTIDLPKKNFSMPFSPATLPPQSPPTMASPRLPRPNSSHAYRRPDESPARPSTATGPNPGWRGHRPQLSRSSNTKSSELLTVLDQPSIRPSQEDLRAKHDSAIGRSRDIPSINFEAEALFDSTDFAASLPTPPLSPSNSSSAFSPRPSDFSDSTPLPQSASTNSSFSASLPQSPSLLELQSRYSRPPTIRPARPKAISVVYSPHGLPLSDLQPYIRNHLLPRPGALPLTCLFHGFDFATNPWFFGGNIMRGAEGGMDIARALMARCWISAHDEEKDDRGVAVKLLKCDRRSPDMVREKLANLDDGWDCDVRALGVGEELRLTADRGRQKQSSGDGLGLGVEIARFQSHDVG